MRFSVQQGFQAAVGDTVVISDPWGMDLHLEIFREGAKELRKLEQEQQRQNPVAHALKVAMLKIGVSIAGARRAAINPDAFRQQLDRELEKANLSSDQLDEFFAARIVAAATRIRSWSGKGATDAETGQPIPCTMETKRELLEAIEPVPESEPLGGQTLGGALVDLVLDASAGADVSRERYLADLGKGSGGTSDGSSEPGPMTPPESELVSAS